MSIFWKYVYAGYVLNPWTGLDLRCPLAFCSQSRRKQSTLWSETKTTSLVWRLRNENDLWLNGTEQLSSRYFPCSWPFRFSNKSSFYFKASCSGPGRTLRFLWCKMRVVSSKIFCLIGCKTKKDGTASLAEQYWLDTRWQQGQFKFLFSVVL